MVHIQEMSFPSQGNYNIQLQLCDLWQAALFSLHFLTQSDGILWATPDGQVGLRKLPQSPDAGEERHTVTRNPACG